MKYVIGNDHGGIDLYEPVKEKLEEMGHDVIHVGTDGKDSVDYPDFAKLACDKVLNNEADYAILICGTGLGMNISANKIDGIRAVAVSDAFSARMSRAHNNANCLCLGARVIGNETAKLLVEEFVKTPFEGGRHQNRLDKVSGLESK